MFCFKSIPFIFKLDQRFGIAKYSMRMVFNTLTTIDNFGNIHAFRHRHVTNEAKNHEPDEK